MSLRDRMAKNKGISIAIIAMMIVGIIFVGSFYSTNLGGGTIWQFDYEWESITIDGQHADETFTVGATPGTWICDPDGPYVYDPAVRNFVGHQAGITATVSLAGRVNSQGQPWNPAIDIVDESQEVINPATNEVIVTWRYYYAFSIVFETEQEQSNAPLNTVEWGSMDIEARMRLIFDKSIFTSNISAYVADAHVDSLDYTDINAIINDYVWAERPEVDIVHHEGTRIDIEGGINQEDYKTAFLTFMCGLTPGVTLAGLSQMPFGTFIQHRVIITMLQEQPFILGDESIPFVPQPPDPPDFLAEFLKNLPLIGAVVAVIIILIIIAAIIIGVAWFRSKQTNITVQTAGGGYY